MKHWYTLHGMIYGDVLIYDSVYVFTSMPIRTLCKYEDYYLLNSSVYLYLNEMDRFFANDLERRKKQLTILAARLT